MPVTKDQGVVTTTPLTRQTTPRYPIDADPTHAEWAKATWDLYPHTADTYLGVLGVAQGTVAEQRAALAYAFATYRSTQAMPESLHREFRARGLVEVRPKRTDAQGG